MRRDDAVLRFQQRIIRADRLGVDHVQSRRSHLSAIERVGNVLLVNELTAGVIDEDDAVLHLGDAVLVDHAGVFQRKVAVQRNDVRAGVKLVQSNIFHDRATGVIRIAKCFVKSIWGILMPVIILVGIFSGYFTPSEAAAVAVIYGALVSMFVYRDLTFKNLCKIIMGSAKTSAIIMIIIACSGIFGYVLANWQIPQQVAAGVLAISDNKYVILLLIAIIILIAGVFMETSSAVILLTPVFLPLVTALGVNLVHFGIVFVVGISIGMITPPVAINLFVASSITELSLETISKKVIPYLLGLIAVYLLYLYIPLFIPGIIT